MLDRRFDRRSQPSGIPEIGERSLARGPTLSHRIGRSRTADALGRRRTIVLARLSLVVCTTYLLTVSATEVGDHPWQLWWLLAAALLSNLAFFWIPVEAFSSKRFNIGLVLADTSWTTAALLFGGETPSSFFTAFFLTLLVVVIAQNLSFMAIGISVIAAAYCYSIYHDDGLAVALSLPSLVRLVLLATIGTLYGPLIDSFHRQRWASLIHLAHHDALTNLPNPLVLHERLEEAIARARQVGGKVALLLLDIDRFKDINDLYGHPVGDQILIEIANRLGNRVRRVDTVSRFEHTASRLGGDEFAVVLTDVRGLDGISTVAARINQLLREPFRLDRLKIQLTASIGIAVYTGGSITKITDRSISEKCQLLFTRADAALYHAKARGRNTVEFFDRKLDREHQTRIGLRQLLHGVLDRNELFVEYQPLVDLETRRVMGAEALVRWQHPKHGLIEPAKFIPIAEGTGEMQEIGDWILRTACHEANHWRSAVTDGIPVVVNLSAVHFADPNFPNTVTRALEETGLPPHLLGFELTEKAFLKSSAEVRQSLRRLHNDLGLRFSLDDFGRGSSSLEALCRLPIDQLKIDRLFIQAIGNDAARTSVISAIIGLATGLDLSVLAEGIETKHQLDFVLSQGCDRAQGFYFSRPITATALRDLIVHGSSRIHAAASRDTTSTAAGVR